MVERGVHAIRARHNLSPQSVKAIAAVNRKADEPALLYLRDHYVWPLETYPAETLDAVGIENPSDTVKRHVGTHGVAEPDPKASSRSQTAATGKG